MTRLVQRTATSIQHSLHLLFSQTMELRGAKVILSQDFARIDRVEQCFSVVFFDMNVVKVFRRLRIRFSGNILIQIRLKLGPFVVHGRHVVHWNNADQA